MVKINSIVFASAAAIAVALGTAAASAGEHLVYDHTRNQHTGAENFSSGYQPDPVRLRWGNTAFLIPGTDIVLLPKAPRVITPDFAARNSSYLDHPPVEGITTPLK